jgi:hypothetical protein
MKFCESCGRACGDHSLIRHETTCREPWRVTGAGSEADLAALAGSNVQGELTAEAQTAFHSCGDTAATARARSLIATWRARCAGLEASVMWANELSGYADELEAALKGKP